MRDDSFSAYVERPFKQEAFVIMIALHATPSTSTFDQERLHTYVVTTHVLEALVGVDRPDFDSTTTS